MKIGIIGAGPLVNRRAIWVACCHLGCSFWLRPFDYRVHGSHSKEGMEVM
jgi:hypothetical protein